MDYALKYFLFTKIRVVNGLCPNIFHVCQNLVLLLDYALKYVMFTKL
jgi:hypothetical protein